MYTKQEFLEAVESAWDEISDRIGGTYCDISGYRVQIEFKSNSGKSSNCAELEYDGESTGCTVYNSTNANEPYFLADVIKERLNAIV